jgi:hypothetical protein
LVEVKVRATGEKQNMKVAEVKDWMINFKSEALK